MLHHRFTYYIKSSLLGRRSCCCAFKRTADLSVLLELYFCCGTCIYYTDDLLKPLQEGFDCKSGNRLRLHLQYCIFPQRI